MPTYQADVIANYFINRANREMVDDQTPEGITNLKLQKILYFAQAAHLALNDKPLFDEEIEAWRFGPVIPGIYQKYKIHSNKPIPTSAMSVQIDENTKVFLDKVWDIYGKYSAAELVQISHNHRPWREAYDSNDGAIITKEEITQYYKGVF